MKWKVISS
jgi:hypothetical protein